MRFIGQNHIMNQLRFILPDLYENKSKGANILLKGPSGYGKTTMAINICRYLAGGSFQIYLADFTDWRFRKRVIFIDEIHRVARHEDLYHIMDGKSHVFVFATNADGRLPEAFVNRCYEFIFDDYSDDELLLIARESCTFTCTNSQLMDVVEAANRNPRILKSLIERLGVYFSRNSGMNISTLDFSKILETDFSIKDGLDTLSRRYLEVLNDVGGIASISLLKSILHVDDEVLTKQVEPVLAKKGLIKITNRGRSLA